MTNRIKSGIPGLDALIQGGFPECSSVLVTGGPGTGKSILGLQFIVYGALNNEPGIYLMFDENKDKLFYQAEQFGWDIPKLENKKRCLFMLLET